MGEPGAASLEPLPPHGKILGALMPDAPWSAARNRSSLLLSLSTAGILAGALQGILLCLQGNPGGDSDIWERIEATTEFGLVIGLATGLAVILSRRISVRVTLAAILAAVLIPLQSLLHGIDPFPLQFRDLKDFLDHPLGIGALLAAPTSATLALSAHLLRNCRATLPGVVTTWLLSVLLGIHSQSYYRFAVHRTYFKDPRIDWDALMAMLSPSGTGGLLFTFCFWLALLVLELISLELYQRKATRWITPLLAGIALLVLTALFWASRAMPLTPRSSIEAIAFGPEGKTLVSAHSGQTLRLWQIRRRMEGEGLSLRELRKVRISWGLEKRVTFATNGRAVLGTWGMGRICLWSGETLDLLGEIDHPDCHFRSPALSKTDTSMAVVNGENEIRLWTAEDARRLLGAPPRILQPGGSRILFVSFSPDGKYLVAVDVLSTITVWDTLNGDILWSGRDRVDLPSIGHAMFAYLHLRASGIQPGSAVLAELMWDEGTEVQDRYREYAHDVSPSGDQLVVSYGDSMEVWEVASLRRIPTQRPGERSVAAVAYSPDGRLIASGDTVGRVNLFQAPVSRGD
jgi:hypothetical protein